MSDQLLRNTASIAAQNIANRNSQLQQEELDREARGRLFNEAIQSNTPTRYYEDFADTSRNTNNLPTPNRDDHVDILTNESLLPTLQDNSKTISKAYNDIASRYNSINQYRPIGGFRGLAKASDYKKMNSEDIAKEIANQYNIESDYLPDLEKRIDKYAKAYNVPTYLAGLAFDASLEHDRGAWSKQFWYKDYTLGKVTSVDRDVEDVLKQFNNKKTLNKFNVDIDHVDSINRAAENFNGVFAGSYGTLQELQDNYSKYRYLPDDVFKALTHQTYTDRGSKALRNFDKASNLFTTELNSVINDLDKRKNEDNTTQNVLPNYLENAGKNLSSEDTEFYTREQGSEQMNKVLNEHIASDQYKNRIKSFVESTKGKLDPSSPNYENTKNYYLKGFVNKYRELSDKDKNDLENAANAAITNYYFPNNDGNINQDFSNTLKNSKTTPDLKKYRSSSLYESAVKHDVNSGSNLDKNKEIIQALLSDYRALV